MGRDTIQSITPATVLDHPTVLGPTPQQTALPGYDAKSAPPSGFRQRIAQAFVQFGRKLSSLVSAPSPGYPRHPDSESLGRSTHKQLVSLLKLVHSGHLDQTKLSVALDALGHEKQQWLQSDPARAEQQFADMVRGVLDQHWPGGKALDLEKALAAMAGPNFASLPQGALREQLTTLVSAGAGEQRAVEALKARHKDEIRRMGFAEGEEDGGECFLERPRPVRCAEGLRQGRESM